MSERYTSKKEIAQIFLSQDGRCKRCSAKVSLHFLIDHIQPLSRGGTDTLDNKQILCTECHRRKTFHPRSEATTLGSDVYEARKTDRLVKGKTKSRSRWPKGRKVGQ